MHNLALCTWCLQNYALHWVSSQNPGLMEDNDLVELKIQQLPNMVLTFWVELIIVWTESWWWCFFHLLSWVQHGLDEELFPTKTSGVCKLKLNPASLMMAMTAMRIIFMMTYCCWWSWSWSWRTGWSGRGSSLENDDTGCLTLPILKFV